MKKQLLLAAAAVSAIAFAGAANAASLSYRAGASALTDTTVGGQYLLARELNFGTGVTSTVGQFDTVVVFNGTGVPAGTYNFTVTYDTGATLNAALPTATVTSTAAVTNQNIGAAGIGFVEVDGAGASLVLTSGGQAGGNTATYTLIVPAGVNVKSIGLAGALRVTGAVQVSTNIINQTTNTAFEPGFSKLPLINVNGVGFAARINGALDIGGTKSAAEDTRILEGAAAPFFTTLTADTRVGQIQIAAASAAGKLNGFGAAFGNFGVGANPTSPVVFKDLNATAVSLTDVVQQSTTIQGQLANLAFTSADAAAVDAPTLPAIVAADLLPASGATVVSTPTTTAHNILTQTPNALRNISVAPANITAAVQLAPTELVAATQLFLKPEFVNPAAVTGNFEQLQSDGFTYIIPWVSSATQAGATGNQTIIRISDISPEVTNGVAGGTPRGRVYAHLLNPTNRAGVTNVGRTVRLADLDANNELVINSATLEAAFGNFQRADLRLVIATTATTGNTLPAGGAGVGNSSIVVKRLLANSAGGLSEVSVVAGDLSSVTNLPVNQGTGY
jgi:hypothetical protein